MKRMNLGKRIISGLIAFVMVLGILPVSIFADDTLLAAAIFGSDIHENKTDLTGSGTAAMKAILSTIGKNGVTYDTIGFVGDTYTDIAGTKADMTSAAQTALGQSAEVCYAWGDHDAKSDISEASGLQYSGDHYYIYHISDNVMRAKANATETTVSTAIAAFKNAVEGMDKTKVLFIMSHVPLHARRNDNTYAYNWYEAIASAAEKMDVVVFWAHNHTDENDVDRAAYYVAKDGDETMTVQGGSTVTPNFTYMNAGYIYANGQNPSRKGVMTTVEIYGDKIVFQDYDSNGEYKDASYSHNVEVAREFATASDSTGTKTLQSISADPEQHVYATGNTFVMPVVTAFYSDGSTALLAPENFTVTGYDMSQAGEQTVTVSYTEDGITKTTTYTIMVAAGMHLTGVELVSSATFTKDAKLSDILASLNIRMTYSYTVNDVESTFSRVVSGNDGHITVTATKDGETVDTLTKDTVVTIKASGAHHGISGEPEKAYTVWSVSDVITDAVYIAVYDEPTESEPVEITTSVTAQTTKTVYVLTNTITAGTAYLIVNSGSTGNPYALANNNGSVSATDVTVQYGDADGDGVSETYIVLEDAADELWTVGGSNTFTFRNGNYYLGYSSTSNYGQTSYTLALSQDTSGTWTYSNNALYFSYRQNNQNRYAYVNYDSYWRLSTGRNTPSNDVYFYVPTTWTEEAEVTTNVTYTMRAEDMKHVIYDTSQGYINTQKLDFCLQGNGADLTELPEGGSYTFQIIQDTADILNGDIAPDGTATFTGNYGAATVKVSYTWTAADKEYTVYKYVTVTAEEPFYQIDLTHKVTAGDDSVTYESITAPIPIKDVKSGDTYDLWAVVTNWNGEDVGDLEDDKLKWVSSNSLIATIDEHTGVVLFTGEEGTVTFTVLYEYGDGKSCTDMVTFVVSKDHYTTPADGTNDFPEYPNEGAIRFDKNVTAVGNFSETGIAKVELSMTGVPYSTGSNADVIVAIDWTNSMDNAVGSGTRKTVTVAAAKEFIKTLMLKTDGTLTGNRIIIYAFEKNNVGHVKLNSTTTTNEWETITEESLTSYDGSTLEEKLDALLDAMITTSTISATSNSVSVTLDSDASSDGNSANHGTYYSYVTKAAYDKFAEAKKTEGYSNKQYGVFMSDGAPTGYYYGVDSVTKNSDDTYSYTYTSHHVGSILEWVSTTDGVVTTSAKDELYTTKAKLELGVTYFSVGLGVDSKEGVNGYSGLDSDAEYEALTTDILTRIATKSTADMQTVHMITDDDASTGALTSAFQNIAQSILDAAKDVKVQDKISDSFTMVFDFPNATVEQMAGSEQEFYIEVLDYVLVAVKDSDGNIIDYNRGTATSKLKLYLGTNADGSYYAATANGSTNGANAFATPTFTTDVLGSLYYWTTDEAKGDSGISVVGADGITYYFISTGKGTHNMVSGAYAYGTPKVDTGSGTGEDATTTCEDLIIATPYFVYNAATKMLVWTADKLSSSELALSYFLYLKGSAGYENSPEMMSAGTYKTNDYAYMTYTNFQNTECEQEMPMPQITWNGAQVSYVFYLVNDVGQPVNRAGRVVPFSEAVYVTDVFTYAVTWNKLEQALGLEADRLAAELVPDVFELYDDGAFYNIHVYEDEAEVNLNNHFVIGSEFDSIAQSENPPAYTTYVFNTKADAQKYSEPGTYISNDGKDSVTNTEYMCKGSGTVTVTVDANGDVTAMSYTLAPGETQTTFASKPSGADFFDGTYAYYLDENNEWYTIVTKTDGTEVETGFDFSNTTVAFAVKWKDELVKDTVVVDFGLDVVINVTENDALAGGVVGLRTDKPAGVEINKGHDNDITGEASISLMIDGVEIGTATVENQTSIRFTFNKENGMKFTEPLTFYYVSAINYYDGQDLLTSRLYSSVTIIPAATIYYEDEFLNLNTHDSDTPQWSTTTDAKVIEPEEEGDTTTVATTYPNVQEVDRPGDNKLSSTYDADNIYGFDSAYNVNPYFSMGSASKVTVGTDQHTSAEFEFYGTGFDVIAVTSNDTGVLIAQVFKPDGNGDWEIMEDDIIFVDTYWGYKFEDGEWTATQGEDPTDLYQIPIITQTGMDYGHYKVRLTATYSELVDHVSGSDSYDLFLDAIRIYDPAGVVANNSANQDVFDAYNADHEIIPTYGELRDELIDAKGFGVDEGAVFIDGIPQNTEIQKYIEFGPNNELYLAANQAVMFQLKEPDSVDYLHIGLSSVDKTVQVTITGYKDEEVTRTVTLDLNTATDMYYDLTEFKGETILIQNTGASGILSVTTLKLVATPAVTSFVMDVITEQTYRGFMLALGASNGTTSGDTTDPGTDDPGTDDPGTDDPGTDDPGTDDPGTDDPGTDDPGTDDPGTDDPGTDDPGTDDPGTDDPGTDDPGTDDPGNNTTNPGENTTDPNGTTNSTDSEDDDGADNRMILIVGIVSAAVLLVASIIVLLKKFLGGK